MPLVFPYWPFTARQPVWSLSGRANRPFPILRVTALGPTGAALKDCLLDTGANDTVFPEAVAVVLGIDVANAVVGEASGVGGAAVPVRYAEVELRITDGVEFRAWRARVGFTALPMRWPLLGFAGFLQFFTATFHGDREKVELQVNGLYPGV